MAQLISGKWEVQEKRRKNKRTGKEVGSETEEVVKGVLKMYCHIGLRCWSAGLVLEEGLPPFSVSLVSMTMMTKRWSTVEVAAFEAGGSPQRPLGGDGTLMGGEEEEKAQSHWGEAGSSQVMSQAEEVGVGEEEEVMEIQRADGAGLSATPAVPTGGLPSSACPA